MKHLQQVNTTDLSSDKLFVASSVIYAKDHGEILWCKQPENGKKYYITHSSDHKSISHEYISYYIYYNDGSVYEGTGNTLGIVDNQQKVTKLVMTDEITAIDREFTLQYNSYITSVGSYGSNCDVQLSNNISETNAYMFQYSSIKITYIPDNISKISWCEYDGSSSLEIAYIPKSITEIEDYAFNGCTSLTDVYYDGTIAEWNTITKGQNIFFNNDHDQRTIHCTDGNI